jgi:urease accessory protein
MSRHNLKTAIAAATAGLVLMPGVALAHPGHGSFTGFTQGFMHPLTGLDHILAMVMVGMLAGRIGGRALWLVPAAFVSIMALGGLVGATGIGLPMIELGIGLSVVVLGGAVALGLGLAVPAAMALVGLFAVFHGYAHGAEIPETVAGLDYGAGFVAATALLHATGLGLAAAIDRNAGKRANLVFRIVGSLTAAAGTGIVLGAM